LDYNLLFCWFVVMEVDEPIWDATVFTKNRDPLHDVDPHEPDRTRHDRPFFQRAPNAGARTRVFEPRISAHLGCATVVKVRRLLVSPKALASRLANQFAVRPRAFTVNLLCRRAKIVEDVFDEGERDFALARVDTGRARFPQGWNIAQVRSPSQHSDVWIEPA